MTDGPVIAVVDYGIGNLHSAQKALAHLGADSRLTSDVAEIAAADAVVLPGVGAFGACMSALRDTGLESAVLDAAASGRPFLGICVGLQMLFTTSDENPVTRGLGIIPGTIRWIPGTVKRPQMQWNVLEWSSPNGSATHMADGQPDPCWMYFVHSYWADAAADDIAATCEYGVDAVAAVQRGRLWATQFHPEKSAANGLHLLENFVTACT